MAASTSFLVPRIYDSVGFDVGMKGRSGLACDAAQKKGHHRFGWFSEVVGWFIATLRLCLMPASKQGKWACFVSQVRWEERRKGEEGAIYFYNFLLSPKGPNEWLNIL